MCPLKWDRLYITKCIAGKDRCTLKQTHKMDSKEYCGGLQEACSCSAVLVEEICKTRVCWQIQVSGAAALEGETGVQPEMSFRVSG